MVALIPWVLMETHIMRKCLGLHSRFEVFKRPHESIIGSDGVLSRGHGPNGYGQSGKNWKKH
ncbi:hypothetical protein QJS10_CPA06g01134 [Acorus calamus]|uniref:Uncharacterized protein n=1 Tax=Acorus calamus TaxID=4465 RepID=A0AAV9ENS6_ACOCL|nr:hypothetical protein QJS10_CPA06g01134 [Acorus calamus]